MKKQTWWKWDTIQVLTVVQYMKQNPVKTKVKNTLKVVAVITDYMKEVMAAVMDGQAVVLPNKFGTLYIKKNKTSTFRLNDVTGKKMVNFNRLGYYYQFVLEGNKLLDHYGFIFKADYKHYRKPLSEILLNTDKDYRTNLIHD